MRRLTSSVAPPQGEDGFTIIEVLVAAFVLVLAAMAVFIGFAGAIHGIQRGREMQQGVSVAQREMERIRIEPFDEVGLTTTTVTPAPPGQTKNPASRVSQNGGREFNLNRTGEPRFMPFTPGDLEVERPEVNSIGGSKMNVFRFVVCEEENATGCVAKRIVVDVEPIPADNANGYQHSYYELQSTIVKP
jgi:type II secretory pathway pseudopilin PulG